MRKKSALVKFNYLCRHEGVLLKQLYTSCFLLFAFLGSALAAAELPVIIAFDDSRNSGDVAHMKDASHHLKTIVGVGFRVGPEGTIVETANAETVNTAVSRNIKYLVAISNKGFDPANARIMFASTTLIPNIVSLVTRNNIAGVSINVAGVVLDIEGINETDRVSFTDFVQRLSNALQGVGKTLMISVAAKEQDYATGWTAPYDYAALSSLPVTLQIMAYDQHSSAGYPGPVAGLDWVKNCLNYALNPPPAGAGVPASKISLGIPAYGRVWDITNTPSSISQLYISWNAIPLLLTQTGAIPQWDIIKSSPYFTYVDSSSRTHKVWYENGQSIRAKAALARSLGLNGVSVFSDEKTDTNFWPALVDGINRESALVGSINNMLLR